MKTLMTLFALAVATLSAPSFAASHKEAPMMKNGAGCEAKAAEKKLAGAAKTSFMKKCEADAGPSACEKQAGEKKLAGAAKTSFVKKCDADAASAAKK